jgi:hypothetical protein
MVPTRNERAGRVGATGLAEAVPARYWTGAVKAPDPSPELESFT